LFRGDRCLRALEATVADAPRAPLPALEQGIVDGIMRVARDNLAGAGASSPQLNPLHAAHELHRDDPRARLVCCLFDFAAVGLLRLAHACERNSSDALRRATPDLIDIVDRLERLGASVIVEVSRG
jgi:hypothetical protein